MYSELVWTWPIISPKEDYIQPAKEFVAAIKDRSLIKTKTLLHLGCGGGHFDYTFKKYFKVTGVDISPGMLGLARRLNPEVNYLIGDMRNIKLRNEFDAVIIADSISYMLSERDLQKAFQTAFNHLKPGGVFATYAEETKEHFKHNAIYTTTHKQASIEITLIENLYDANPDDTLFESAFVYLIRKKSSLAIETDCHTLGLFKYNIWLKLLRKTGFKVIEKDFFKEKIPGFICVKP
jgi:SAM-dependent methyltransferase